MLFPFLPPSFKALDIVHSHISGYGHIGEELFGPLATVYAQIKFIGNWTVIPILSGDLG